MLIELRKYEEKTNFNFATLIKAPKRKGRQGLCPIGLF